MSKDILFQLYEDAMETQFELRNTIRLINPIGKYRDEIKKTKTALVKNINWCKTLHEQIYGNTKTT